MFESQAEDVFVISKRGRYLKRSEQGVIVFHSPLEAQEGDFTGGGVHVVVVVEVVLEPGVGAFDLASGLRGEGVDDVDAAVIHDLLLPKGGPPALGVDLVGYQVMFAPQGVAALDEAEDGRGVNVVGEGAAECGNEGVRGTDMEPGGF